MDIWQIISSTTDYQCPFFKVKKDKIIYPSGRQGYYWILEGNNFSIVIPLAKNITFLVGQYRYATKEYSWEFPMGGLEDKETFLDCSQRELLEETGITAKDWTQIGSFNVAPGHSSQKAAVFIAQKLQFGKSRQTESEDLKLKKISVPALFQLAKNGKITDGPTLVTLFMLENYLLKKV